MVTNEPVGVAAAFLGLGSAALLLVTVEGWWVQSPNQAAAAFGVLSAATIFVGAIVRARVTPNAKLAKKADG